MLLYHGTSAQYLEKILEQGILPRCISGQKGNWRDKLQSKPDLVYVSTACPVYYAMQAANGEYDLAVIKVNLKKADLYPDEDFIAWSLKSFQKDAVLEDLISEINPLEYKEMAAASIEYNGTACTLGISIGQIIDYKIIQKDKIDLIIDLGGDSIPTPINYMAKGEEYKQYLDLWFKNGELAVFETIENS